MKITVFTSPNRDDREIKNTVIGKFIEAGFTYDEENPDLVVYLGGDGTFLRSVNHYVNILDKVKFVGICIGTLGFYYDFNGDEIDKVIELIKSEKYKINEHRILESKIDYAFQNETIYGVNEIRIENPFHTLICDVYINDKYFETFRGNGLLACTSLGSSAYNKSLGGALLPHNKDLLELTEIVSIHNNAFNSLNSPLVLNEDDHVTLKGEFHKAVVGFDFSTSEHESPISLDIFLSNKRVKIIRPSDYSYIQSIKKSFIK